MVLNGFTEGDNKKNLLDSVLSIRDLEGLWQFREHFWKSFHSKRRNWKRMKPRKSWWRQPPLQICATSSFESVSELKDAGFAEGGAENLEANRKIFLRRFAAGDRDAGDSGKRSGHSVNVGEIHLEWIVRFFAEFESGDR